MSLIGQVQLTPPEALAGQSVLVEVLDSAGRSYEGQDDVTVTVNGVTGARQYLQFVGSGPQRVLVALAKDGVTEQQVATVTLPTPDPALPLAEAPALAGAEGARLLRFMRVPGAGIPLLHLARSPHVPTLASFSAGTTALFARGLNQRPPPALLAQRLRRLAPSERPGRFSVKLMRAGSLADQLAEPALPPPVARYHWDFGDGTSLVSDSAGVEHDYEGTLDPTREQQTFHVTLRIERGGEEVEVRRSLSVINAYAVSRRLGFIVPRVRSSGFARRLLGGLEASFTAENLEPVPLTLTSRRLLRHPATPDETPEMGPVVALQPPITVPARTAVAIPITLSPGELPVKSAGFTAYFAGQTPDGLPVRLEASFDVPLREQQSSGLKIGDLAVTHLAALRDAVRALGQPQEPQPRNELALDTASTTLFARHQTLKLGAALRRAPAAELAVAGRAGQERRAPHLTAAPAQPRAFQTLGLVQRDQLHQVTAQASGLLRGGERALLDRVSLAGLLDRRMFDVVTPAPAEGQECDPENIDESAAAEDWVCQATPEKREVITPGRFMNAQKGDVILSPGGGGLIGGLLRQVMPPQRYSHSGIMTRNHTEVTHSTASEERLLAYPVGSIAGEPQPSDGHRPDILKYGWPGVVTQSIEHAIHGEDMLDPETASLPPGERRFYSISSFSPHREGMDLGGHWELVPPMVVKPDPMLETPELRARLRQVAEDARAQAGKSHYRFYCYTDPTLGLREAAPPEAGWAAGTYPSVCSSFVWMMLKKHGVRLEGDGPLVRENELEPADRSAGAQVNDATQDGLYLYTRAERLAAGEFLFQALHAKVMHALDDKAGILAGLVNAFSDMADDVGNQVTNAFAKDWTDTDAKDSDAWRDDTGDSNAVSPDNILLWDSPALGGVYGYAAPLVYLEPRPETITVYRWRKVLTKGRLSGTVFSEGQPVAGALVQLYDGMTDFTDAAGRYQLDHVPFGSYVVRAAKDGGPVYLSASAPLELNAASAVLDLTLKGPSDMFRMVTVRGTMHIVDFEDFGADERADRGFSKDLFVGPYGTHAEQTFVERLGGEVRVELHVVVDWRLDKSVHIRYEHRFYEGASEDTDDLDGSTDKDFDLAADHWQQWNSNIHSGNAGESQISLTFENVINPN